MDLLIKNSVSTNFMAIALKLVLMKIVLVKKKNVEQVRDPLYYVF